MGCYQEVTTLARYFVYVADEIHIGHIEIGEFPRLDDVLHSGWQTMGIIPLNIPHLCEVLQRAIDVLNRCAAEERPVHPADAKYYETEGGVR